MPFERYSIPTSGGLALNTISFTDVTEVWIQSTDNDSFITFRARVSNTPYLIYWLEEKGGPIRLHDDTRRQNWLTEDLEVISDQPNNYLVLRRRTP